MTESLRMLMFLMGAYYFLQCMGGNPGLHTQALQRFVKEGLHYDAGQAAEFSFLITIPWMIKPIYGFISDFFPIFGLRRKSYFILTSALAAAALMAVSLSPLTRFTLPLLMFVVGVGIASTDVLTDAVMVEKGQPLNATDRLQAAQWTFFSVASILVALVKGYIAEFSPLSEAVRFSVVAPGLVIVLTILALREPPVASSRESARQAWEGLKNAAKTKPLWGAAIFIFLFQCSPNLGTVMYYYEKDALHFKDTLIGNIDTVGSVGSLLGALAFGAISKRMSHGFLVRAMIIVGTGGGLLYLFFKSAVSAFVVSGAANLLGMIPFLGILVIAAKVCPKHAEGSTFALMMAVSNLGAQTGGILGGKIYAHFTDKPRGYFWLVIISNALTAVMWIFIPLVRPPKPAE